MRALIVFIAFASLALHAECLANQPVLSLMGINQPMPIPLGDVIDSAMFKDQLTHALKSVKTLNVILVNSNEQLGSDKFLKQIRNSDHALEADVVYQPAVDSAYSTLTDTLKQTNTENNIIETDSLSDGFEKFIAAQNQKTPVILLQKEMENNRMKRAVDNQAQNETRNFAFGEQCAAFFDSVTYVDESTSQTSVPIELPVTKATFTCPPGLTGSQTLTIEFGTNQGISSKTITQISFQFQASSNSLNFRLNASTLTLNNQETHPLVYMGAPYGMETPINYSFACTRTPFMLRVTNHDPKLNLKAKFYFENMQVQPLGMTPNNTQYTFGPVNYCQGFFSSGIWMAITSTLLLALILACGVTALMTIQTNDRLDDPKGKPLNIGVEK